MRNILRSLALFLYLFSGASFASTDGWISTTPLPSGVIINDMDCRPDGLCVAVGQGGSILTSSTDGQVWLRQDAHSMHRLYDVVYAGAGKGFWVVGEGGLILQGSEDGTTWTVRDSGVRKALFGVAYGRLGDGREILVAVGQQGVLLVSQDLGVTWARPARSGLPKIFPSYEDVTFVNGRFIAVGSSAGIVQSFDGLSWQSEALDDQGKPLYVPTLGADHNELAVGTVGGVTRYVVVGEGGVIRSSDDAIRWTTRAEKKDPNEELLAVTWDGGQFVAVGLGGRVLTSADGILWTALGVLTNRMMRLVEVHWDESHSRYLVAGSFASKAGFIKASTGPTLDNWRDLNSAASSAVINGLAALDAANGSGFVAVGSGGAVLLSDDGNAWAAPVTLPPGAPVLNAVAAAGADLVAIGDVGQIYRSADAGLNWTGPVTPVPTANSLNAITYNVAGHYLAVGDAATILLSTDSGASWSTATSIPLLSSGAGPVNLTGVAWSPSLALYVAVGKAGTILSSPDGLNWTRQSIPQPVPVSGVATDDLSAVAWADQRFIAVGQAGLVLTSSDGLQWSGGRAVEIPIDLLAIAWDGANIVLSGNAAMGICPPSASASTALFMSSDHGASWAGHEVLGCNIFNTIAWNGTQFVAGGWKGLLVTSGGLDTAVNPILNASVDTLSGVIPTQVTNGVPSSYPLTVTNNGNLDVPKGQLQLIVTFVPGSEVIWRGATITVDRSTTAILCDTSLPLKVVCTIPVGLKVFPLPTGQSLSNRPKEGVDVTVTLEPGINKGGAASLNPQNIGTLDMTFSTQTMGLSMVDQNSTNNVLHVVSTVRAKKLLLCDPDVFLSCNGVSGTGSAASGGGAFGLGLMISLMLNMGLVWRRFSRV